MRWIFAAVLSAFVAACTLDDVSLQDKRCPCAAGWTCNEREDVCVRGTPDAAMDAGSDGALPDARPDAPPPRDAGPEDGGPPDADRDDGGAPDAGTDAGSDAGSDAGEADAGRPDSECDGTLSDAIFCDGFDDASGFTAWSGGTSETDGNVSRVTDPVYRGSGALRAETTATAGDAFLRSGSLTTVGSGPYWLRFYAYFPASSPLSHADVAAIYSSTSSTDSAVFVYTDTARLWIGETETTVTSTDTLPRDTWTCFQVRLAVSDTDGEAELFMDGTSLGSVATDTRPGSGYDGLAAGITYSADSQEPTVVYLDEIAVGTSPLPCD